MWRPPRNANERAASLRRRRCPLCPQCRHNLLGTLIEGTHRCPECGCEFDTGKVVLATEWLVGWVIAWRLTDQVGAAGQGLWLMAVGAFVLVLAVGLFVVGTRVPIDTSVWFVAVVSSPLALAWLIWKVWLDH